MNPDYAAFLAAKAPRAMPQGIDPGPMPDHLFDYQKDVVAFLLKQGRGAAAFLDTGLGKALRFDWPVATPDGWKAIGSLKVGDAVMGPDGHPRTVLGVYPQGVRRMHRVTFSDGAEAVCDEEHLWTVNTKLRRSRGLPFVTKSLKQIMDEGLKDQAGARHFVPMPEPIKWVGTKLPVDPYLLGVLIGDGCLTHSTPSITTDKWIVERLDLPHGNQISWGEHPSPGIVSVSITRILRGKSEHPLMDALHSLGMMGCAANSKFIPQCYMTASEPDRWAILAGLLDTDGSVAKDGNIEWGSVSLTLARDTASLIRSLGGTARIKIRPEPQFIHNGERRTGQTYYRMSVRLPPIVNPFRLPRKAERWQPLTKYLPVRSIKSIEDAEYAEAVCIKVDADDGLFVIKDGVVTHNTRVQLEWCKQAAAAGNDRALILTPLAVARQIETEAQSLGYRARVVRSQEDTGYGINICNYDRLDKLNVASFSAVSLDESSILKSFTGKTTQCLISAFAKTPYKLCATATPAPNDHTEIGTHAEFLGIMSRSEMLVRWFINDSGDTKSWRLKGHAREAFWDWMASWARMAETPADLGYDATRFKLPELITYRHKTIGDTRPPPGLLFAGDVSATTMHDVKRQTAEARAQAAADLVRKEPDQAWIVWCDTDYEQDALNDRLPEAVDVRGSMTAEKKEAGIADFISGEKPWIISKSSVMGFGMNYQHCARMIFVGRSFSYEAWYQAVRRCWRFGQKRPVHVHLIVAEGEDQIGRVIDRKASGHVEMKRAMGEAMKRNRVEHAGVKVKYNPEFDGDIPAWLSAA